MYVFGIPKVVAVLARLLFAGLNRLRVRPFEFGTRQRFRPGPPSMFWFLPCHVFSL